MIKINKKTVTEYVTISKEALPGNIFRGTTSNELDGWQTICVYRILKKIGYIRSCGLYNVLTIAGYKNIPTG